LPAGKEPVSPGFVTHRDFAINTWFSQTNKSFPVFPLAFPLNVIIFVCLSFPTAPLLMHTLRFRLLWFLGCFSWLGTIAPLAAQEPVPPLPLFTSHELVEATLHFDIQDVQEDRRANPDYHPAIFSYVDEAGDTLRMNVEVKARGKYRLDPTVCNFPPLRMKFKDDDDDLPPLFRGQGKLKMVTHCQSDDYILREYYLYRLYNLLTDISFRVRLFRIQYVDLQGQLPTETHFSFFIEDEDDVAARHGAVEVRDDVDLDTESVDREMLTLVHVFNYLIANKDFNIPMRQNLKVITNPDPKGKPIPVPYDFDWAGIVDASYTKLSGREDEDAYEKRQVFKALCRSQEEYDVVFETFRAAQDEIWALYETSPYLEPATIKRTLKWYKSFYKQIKKEKEVQATFVEACKE
jgi:hypothetical protein